MRAASASLLAAAFLHDLELNLLNFSKPLPLLGDEVIHLLVKVANLELSLEVHAIVIEGAQTVLRFLALLTHHDDRRLDRSQA